MSTDGTAGSPKPSDDDPVVVVVKPQGGLKGALDLVVNGLPLVITLAGLYSLTVKLALAAALFNASGGYYILLGAVKQARKQYEDYVAQQTGRTRRDVVFDEEKQKFVYGPRPYHGISWPPDFAEMYGWGEIISGGGLVLVGSIISVVAAVR